MVFFSSNFALHVHGDLAGQVTARHGGGHVGDVAHLAGEIGRHQIHIVRQILPRAGHAGHLGLAAELALGADFARDAAYFGGEGVEPVDHRVDRFLQLQNLALHIDGDLARQVAECDRRRDVGDVAHLRGQIVRHRIHVVGEILPRARHARHLGQAAELAFRTDFARDAAHLGSKAVELVDHRVDGVLQFENLAAHFDGDLARQGRPFATAVVTSAMLRTCVVRLFAIELTLSVKSLPRCRQSRLGTCA